jgi:hypothetical protein
MARVFFIFIENYEIENVVIYFQQVGDVLWHPPIAI